MNLVFEKITSKLSAYFNSPPDLGEDNPYATPVSDCLQHRPKLDNKILKRVYNLTLYEGLGIPKEKCPNVGPLAHLVFQWAANKETLTLAKELAEAEQTRVRQIMLTHN